MKNALYAFLGGMLIVSSVLIPPTIVGYVTADPVIALVFGLIWGASTTLFWVQLLRSQLGS